MDAQIFQFKDPEKWGPEFGGEIATLMKEFVERKLAPLRIAVANLEAKNAILSAEIAAHRSVKYMGVHKPGAEYSEGSLVTRDGSVSSIATEPPEAILRRWQSGLAASCEAWPRRQRWGPEDERDKTSLHHRRHRICPGRRACQVRNLASEALRELRALLGQEAVSGKDGASK